MGDRTSTDRHDGSSDVHEESATGGLAGLSGRAPDGGGTGAGDRAGLTRSGPPDGRAAAGSGPGGGTAEAARADGVPGGGRAPGRDGRLASHDGGGRRRAARGAGRGARTRTARNPRGVVTLDDVARLAGVSLATASRVLGPASARRVGSELRERVEKAARQLGYTPNLVARTLAHGASDLVGLVVPGLAEPYFAALADGVLRAAERDGLAVLVGAGRGDPEREIAHLATLRAQRARAIVLAGVDAVAVPVASGLRAELERYQAIGGRVACVARELPAADPGAGPLGDLPVDLVVPDDRGGASRLAQALAALGHRRFAVLAGPPELPQVRERVAGFTAGLIGAGLPAPRVLHAACDRDGGRAAAERLLAEGTDATCLFAVSDAMALGALDTLRARGVPVPDALSLAGFGDHAGSPDLTTVRPPAEGMGERALDLALRPAPAAEPYRGRVVAVPGEVVVRGSVRRIG
ncbi:LacI family DNA-binding transcriptional regulator [Thermopolyspora flexuosa]|uniref:LacI family DNA-binding transcriptional regulator n=1 Tax=Thermopolyspora flexuosa TaxID=103836 RepID=UPI0027BA95F1|nr:LacI family DNA-binding transcriptional regulator [Thermopolyspora flexuosa]